MTDGELLARPDSSATPPPVGHRTSAGGDGTFRVELVDAIGLTVRACDGFMSKEAGDEWAHGQIERWQAAASWELRR
jgi:hypothetical protein